MSHHFEDLFEKLESNDKELVEKFKRSIREQFVKTNEPWLMNGLFDYYLNSNSVRCMELIIDLTNNHHIHLFERLFDCLKNVKNDLKAKVQALTLLGHIARYQPTWLKELPEHPLFKEILKFSLSETELLPLISALLVLIVLLPMYPSFIGAHHLDEIFKIFRRLAAWNSQVPSKLGEDQMIHLQVALYALFLRLYGMFPCNFLYYLRSEFRDRNNPVFCHTIKPMMDTVKMHPSLVTTTKENETTTERWKKMAVHDVIVECERFSLDITDRCPHETCQNTTEFRSRSNTMNSTIGTSSDSNNYHQNNVKSLATLQMSDSNDDEFVFSPSHIYHIQNHQNSLRHYQDGSPPEAAIEATPETTPVRDFTAATSSPLSSVVAPSTKNNVARALTSFRTNSGGYFVSGTPTNSVPSSPLRKEPAPFIYPSSSSSASSLSQNLVVKLTQERQGATELLKSSPLKILNFDQNRQKQQRPESPINVISGDDEEEVSSSVLVHSATTMNNKANKKNFKLSRTCDSILSDFEDSGDNKKDDDDDIEQGSPCAAGGLHMPNSKSIHSFKKRFERYRYYSQCNPEPEYPEISTTGSSPGNNGVNFISNSNVRRANSCPDMKKSRHSSTTSNNNRDKSFCETEEEETVSSEAEKISNNNSSNGFDARLVNKEKFSSIIINSATQTDVFWPMPYEHLFLNIFPSLKEDSIDVNNQSNNAGPSSSSSAPVLHHQSSESYNKPSLYEILDKYIEHCIAAVDNNNSLKDQLKLVHQQLLFERHRRETHAYRNRRLLSDAKNTRLLEEYNSALRDQVQLGQKEIDDLRNQLEEYRKEIVQDKKTTEKTVENLKEQCRILTNDNLSLKESIKKFEINNLDAKLQFNKMDKERQQAAAALLEITAECKIAKEQAVAAEKVKQQFQHVNRELLLMGELNDKYKEKLIKLSSNRECDEEIHQLSEAYKEELKQLQRQIDKKTILNEGLKARVHDLEHLISIKEEIILLQKRTLASGSEEREAQLEAVESKYQTQLAINRILEEKILELRYKLETEAAVAARIRRTNSPDTSSCHEVQASSTSSTTAILTSSSAAVAAAAAGGLQSSSPHSSPSLSASLASSEGSSAIARE